MHQTPTETVTRPKPLIEFALTTGTGTFVPAANDFGFRVLQAVTASSPAPQSANIFISPLSLSLALTMAMDGAGGATRQQMQMILGYPRTASDAVIDSDASGLLGQYAGNRISPAITMNIASALWPNLAFPPRFGHLSPVFASRMARVFGSAVEAVDFARITGAQRVNDWTKEHTAGKIASILPNMPLGSAVALVLTNAVYFKAKWHQSFDPAQTQTGDFKLADGRRKPVPLMQMTDQLPYMRRDGFQALRLPYDDGRFSFCVMLPDIGVDLTTFAKRYLESSTQFNGYLANFVVSRVAVKLPRFKIAYNAGELVDPLKRMGLTAPFDRRVADFSPMGYPHGYIGSVRHKTTLVVDESGSEATAVTAVTMIGATAIMHRVPEPVIPFIVDRPFFCVIRDNATGALLFVGQVFDPDAA